MRNFISLIIGIVCLLNTAFAYEFPLIKVRSGGEFYHWTKIVDDESVYPKTEADRIINFDNVSIIRNINTKEVEVDKSVNILFSSVQERDKFIRAYEYYIHHKSINENNIKAIIDKSEAIQEETSVHALYMQILTGIGLIFSSIVLLAVFEIYKARKKEA